jgi:hypothetical protein
MIIIRYTCVQKALFTTPQVWSHGAAHVAQRAHQHPLAPHRRPPRPASPPTSPRRIIIPPGPKRAHRSHPLNSTTNLCASPIPMEIRSHLTSKRARTPSDVMKRCLIMPIMQITPPKPPQAPSSPPDPSTLGLTQPRLPLAALLRRSPHGRPVKPRTPRDPS